MNMQVEKVQNSEIDWPINKNKIIRNLLEVLDSNRWAISGYWTNRESMDKKFSNSFAAYNNVPYCTLTTGGSSALLIALEALDIGEGDEVIVPALTWLATATAVLNVNAKPVLVDVSVENYCLDPEKIEEAITDKTKAIIVVHLAGCMADMDKIMDISRKYNIRVIEDCAQSIGSIWDGKKAGTIGDIGTFSFQQGKVLTSGEGGAAITKDFKLYKKLEQLRSDSRSFTNQCIRYGDMELVTDGSIQGTNYCLSEFQSAILLAQLEDLDKENLIRQENSKYLNEKLIKINGVKVIKSDSKLSMQSYYSYIIKIDKNIFNNIDIEKFCKDLRDKLNTGNFFIHNMYPPINKNVLFCPWTKKRYSKDIAKDKTYWRTKNFKVSEEISNESIVLHHSILLLDRNKLDVLVYNIEKLLNEYKSSL